MASIDHDFDGHGGCVADCRMCRAEAAEKERDDLASRGPAMQLAVNAAADQLGVDREALWGAILEHLGEDAAG